MTAATANSADVLKPGGFFVIGDLFRRVQLDTDYFRGRSTLIKTVDEGPSGTWEYKIFVLKKQETE
jgi:hypothetical protein